MGPWGWPWDPGAGPLEAGPAPSTGSEGFGTPGPCPGALGGGGAPGAGCGEAALAPGRTPRPWSVVRGRRWRVLMTPSRSRAARARVSCLVDEPRFRPWLPWRLWPGLPPRTPSARPPRQGAGNPAGRACALWAGGLAVAPAVGPGGPRSDSGAWASIPWPQRSELHPCHGRPQPRTRRVATASTQGQWRTAAVQCPGGGRPPASALRASACSHFDFFKTCHSSATARCRLAANRSRRQICAVGTAR
mmetsp:Transcript_8137/g.27631  ORF Transcript_8137/g.27631 Transcript_8137/m.27631 type:complete len:247 (-) Transcript_8137:81-821(-)